MVFFIKFLRVTKKFALVALFNLSLATETIDEPDLQADPVEPWCYLPTGIGYTFDSQSAGTTYLVKNNGPKSPWGNEAKQITFKSTTLGATLNLKIGASGTFVFVLSILQGICLENILEGFWTLLE